MSTERLIKRLGYPEGTSIFEVARQEKIKLQQANLPENHRVVHTPSQNPPSGAEHYKPTRSPKKMSTARLLKRMGYPKGTPLEDAVWMENLRKDHTKPFEPGELAMLQQRLQEEKERRKGDDSKKKPDDFDWNDPSLKMKYSLPHYYDGEGVTKKKKKFKLPFRPKSIDAS